MSPIPANDQSSDFKVCGVCVLAIVYMAENLIRRKWRVIWKLIKESQ